MVVSDVAYSTKYSDYVTAITSASNDHWNSIKTPTSEKMKIKDSMLKHKKTFQKYYTRYSYDKVEGTLVDDDYVSFDRIEATKKLITYTRQLNFVYKKEKWFPNNKINYNEMLDYLLDNIQAEKILPYVHAEIDYHYAEFLKKIDDEPGVFATSRIECESQVFNPIRTKIDAQTFQYWQQNIRELIQIIVEFYSTLHTHVTEKDYEMRILPLDEFFDILRPLGE